jgi:hypothetical protein
MYKMTTMAVTYLHYIAIYALYSMSICMSFIFTGFLIKPLTLRQLEEDEEEDKKLMKRLEEENFEYKYLDEYEQLEEIELSLDKLNEIKDKEITLEIPFLKATIIMFYEDDTFKYYCNTDVIYKYLNVACRKFVIEHNVKKLYIDGQHEENKTESVHSELFVTKAETKTLERKINHFIRIGSIHDYNDKNNIKLVKEIDILDFLQMNKSNQDK